MIIEETMTLATLNKVAPNYDAPISCVESTDPQTDSLRGIMYCNVMEIPTRGCVYMCCTGMSLLSDSAL